jgi:protease I
MKALFIIAFRNFQDFEFLKTKEILEKNKIECDVCSTQKGIALGTFGASFKVSKILEEVQAKDYDCIIFVGGAGTPSVRAKKEAIKLAENSFKLWKIVCAICWAPRYKFANFLGNTLRVKFNSIIFIDSDPNTFYEKVKDGLVVIP